MQKCHPAVHAFLKMKSIGELSLSLIKNGFLDTISRRKFDPGFLALADDDDVAESGGKSVTLGVLDVDDIERTGVLLDVLDDTDSADVVSVLNEADVTRFEMSESLDLSGSNIVLEGITNLDFGVRESDGSSIVSDNVRDLVGTNGLVGDLQELDLVVFFK